MIEQRTRRAAALAAAALLALTGAAGASGHWTVTRDGDVAVATRSGGAELTTATALAKEADAAIRAATGCGIAGMGPTRVTKAQFKAFLDCKG